MAVDGLVATCTNVSGILSVELREAYNQATVSVEITCTSHTLSVGDTVNITLGTVSNNATVVTGGIVQKIIVRVPQFDYVITIQDKLYRAVNFFIASDDPLSPYYAHNIKAEDLVVYLLGLAGITGVSASSTIFTYGVNAPGTPINLTSVWEMVDTISKVCGFITYCDAGGTIHFMERKPYVTASDTVSSHSYTTGNSGDILTVEYDVSVENLRNRIVAGNGNGLHYTAEDPSSPYLPTGFFQTLAIYHPLLDNLPAITQTALLNLEIFDRLTETVSLTVKGDVTVRLNSLVTVSESFSGIGPSTIWLVNGSTMSLSSQSGFTQQLTLIR